MSELIRKLTANMSIGQKMLVGFLGVSLLVAAVGIFGLLAINRTARHFEGGEVHFRSIVIAATDVSTTVKSAESSLVLFLALHDPADREIFDKRCKTLESLLASLDKSVRIPEARKILEETRTKARDFASVGASLLRVFDDESKNTTAFDYRKYGPLLKDLNAAAGKVRQSATDLARFETNFLNRQRAITAATEIASLARRAEGHLMLYLTVGEPDDREKFFGRLQALKDQIDGLDEKVTMWEGVDLLKEIMLLSGNLRSSGVELLELYDSDAGRGAAFSLVAHRDPTLKLNTAATQLSDRAVELAKTNLEIEALPKERALQYARYLQFTVLLFVIAAFVSSLALGYASVQTISKPLRRLRDAARDIGQGNFDTHIEVRSQDEVGQLSASFNAMAEDLKSSRFELTTAKDYLDSIIRSLIDSLIVTTPEGLVYTVNPATCRMLGYYEKDLVGQPLLNYLDERSPLRRSGFGEILRRGVLRSDEIYVARDGRKIPVIFSSSVLQHPDGEILGVVCLAEDITERTKAEEALRKSEELFRLSFDYAPIGIAFAGLDRRLLRVNRAFCEILGYTAEELTERSFADITHPDDLPANVEMNEKLLRGEIPYHRIEKRYVRKSGRIVHAILNVTLVRDTDGRPLHFLAQVIDITARKLAEEAIEQSNRRNQLLLEAMGEGMFGIDTEGRLTFVNPSALEMLGYKPEELAGQRIHDLIHHTTVDGVACPFDACPTHLALTEGKRCHVREDLFWRKNGTSFPVDFVTTPIWESGSIVGAVVVFVDITDRKRLEEELIKARKLESIGFLARGIGHDYNNLLTGILSCLTLAKSAAGEPETLSKTLSVAEDAVRQAKELTNQLFTFARLGEPLRKVTSLARLVREAATVSLTGTGCGCEFDIADDLWEAAIDEGQFSRVIHNLVINAAQACPAGGTVRISAANLCMTEWSATPLKRGNYVQISVTDRGVGIAPENLSRIFDPYFTTKQRGSHRGTGLGLSICYAIVRGHDGLITVESKRGEGTTFTVYLPASPHVSLHEA